VPPARTVDSRPRKAASHFAFERDDPHANSLCSTSVLPTRSGPPPRLKFTKAFKEETVRRLELGAGLVRGCAHLRGETPRFCTGGGANCGTMGPKPSPAMDSGSRRKAVRRIGAQSRSAGDSVSGINQPWIPFEQLHHFRDTLAGPHLNVERANAFGSGFEVAKMRSRPRQSDRACVRWRKMRKRRN